MRKHLERWHEKFVAVPTYLMIRATYLLVLGFAIIIGAYYEAFGISPMSLTKEGWSLLAFLILFCVSSMYFLRIGANSDLRLRFSLPRQLLLLVLSLLTSLAANWFVFQASQYPVNLYAICFVLMLPATPAAGLTWPFAALLIAFNSVLAASYLTDSLSKGYLLQIFSGQLFGFGLFRTMLSEFQQKSLANHRLAELLATQRMLKSEVELDTRRRIARDLHDELGHLSTVVSNNLERYLHTEPNPSDIVIETQELVQRLNRQIRNLSATLYDTCFDLTASLQTLAEHTKKPEIQITTHNFSGRCGANVAEAIFRASQEAITNCIKHSNATKLAIHIAVDDESYRVEIKDNGTNGKHLSYGFGLKGLVQRIENLNGKTDIQLTSEGCNLTFAIPNQ